MTPLGYLLDRGPLLLSFALALLFLLLVVHLGVAPLSLADAAYILLLAAAVAALILFVDYRSQLAFRRHVRQRLRRASASSFEVVPLPAGKTREQRALAALFEGSQRQALEALQEHRRAADEHRAFVDLWVHQMKTPLAVLELTAAQEDGSDAWRSVAEETASLAQGLELMLTSARLEGFELDLAPSTVDLLALARAGVNALKDSWIRHGIFPSVDAPQGAVLAETDPKWLAVVLRQLLTNAMKYSRSGERVRLTVAQPNTGSGATLTVTDAGPGIPSDEVPRVFERFFTGTNGRQTQASTGMGLYLAAEICRRLGHELSVTSTVGEGSAFTITLRPDGLHRVASPKVTGV